MKSHEKPPSSHGYGFLMVFLFNHHFPMVFPWCSSFSHGFPLVFPWFSTRIRHPHPRHPPFPAAREGQGQSKAVGRGPLHGDLRASNGHAGHARGRLRSCDHGDVWGTYVVDIVCI